MNIRGAFRARSVLLVTLPLLCPDPGRGPAIAQYRTEHVVVVAIDGLRNHEAFESRNLNMPMLWDSLRPLGTIYTEFWNRGITVTNAGHSTLVTGVHQMLPNNSGIPTPVRPLQPTLGEYFRRERGVPPEEAVEISGKTSIWRYPAGLYPGYGYPWASRIVLTAAADTVTWDSTRAILLRDHPALMYVVFAQVDKEGHTADTVKYLGAIRRVDSLIFLLWRTIQDEPVTRDRTTMIVTSDHGRHDEANGGWRGHGDFCHGCRHILFFAVGPDIAGGRTFTHDRCQLDVVPTVAALLGFEAPLAEGCVMTEMLLAPPAAGGRQAETAPDERNLSAHPAPSRAAAIAAAADRLVVLYSEGEEGSRSIRVRSSVDGGSVWSTASDLFTSSSGQYTETGVAADGELMIAASTGWERFDGDSTSTWVLAIRRSTDAGGTWGPVQRLDTLGRISTAPSVDVAGDRVSIVANSGYAIRHLASTDGGATFTNVRLHTASSTTPVCALGESLTVAAWRHLRADDSPYWNILADRSPWRSGDHPVTTNDSSMYSYAPAIAAGVDSLAHLVYAHLTAPHAETRWDLQYRSVVAGGDAWSPPLSIAPGRNAFAPAIVQSPSGVLHVVWEDEENGGRSIRGARSTDHGSTWRDPVRYSTISPWACRPAVAERNDTLHIVWEDFRTGDWEIFHARVPLGARITPPLLPGWNLVSVPVECSDGCIRTLFPGVETGAFAFGAGGYELAETLVAGRGYWVKVPGDWAGYPSGASIWSDTLDLREGWNLIGTITDPVPVAEIVCMPPGILASPFFGFAEGGYSQAAVLEPGRAYWVNAVQAGRIRMGRTGPGSGGNVFGEN